MLQINTDPAARATLMALRDRGAQISFAELNKLIDDYIIAATSAPPESGLERDLYDMLVDVEMYSEWLEHLPLRPMPEMVRSLRETCLEIMQSEIEFHTGDAPAMLSARITEQWERYPMAHLLMQHAMEQVDWELLVHRLFDSRYEDAGLTL